MLYHSLVLPLFEYCDHIFDCLTQKDSLMIERLQNTCLRNILGNNKSSSATENRTELKQDSLALRRDMHTANEMYKIVHKIAPVEISRLFTSDDRENAYALTRHTRNELIVPRCNLECGKRNFRYRGATNWNSIPIDIRSQSTLKAFKVNILPHLRNKHHMAH